MSLTTDDTIEILQLYARYNTAIDTGDADGFAACFVPEGRFDPGIGVQEGHSALAAFAKQTHDAMPAMRHDATNIVVEGDGGSDGDPDGKRATGSAFLIGYTVDGGYKVIVTGRYADRLTRTPEGWRFTERIFEADG